MSIESLPFILGLVVTLLQPIFDRIWHHRHKEVWTDGDVNTEPPLGGAIWAADVAGFLPTATLTVLGVALLVDVRNGGAYGEVVVILVGLPVAFAVYVWAAARKGIPRKPKTWWSTLQYGLMVLNVIGLCLCIWLPMPAAAHPSAVAFATAKQTSR